MVSSPQGRWGRLIFLPYGALLEAIVNLKFVLPYHCEAHFPYRNVVSKGYQVPP